MTVSIDRRALLGSALALGACSTVPAPPPAPLPTTWTKLPTEPYRGKQDDVVFVDRSTGWYGNGQGKLYRTADGGASWTKIMDRPGTFVRALGFVDASTGFLGNVGTDYFPNVSDETPLYRTRDGGATWEPVTYDGPRVKGICAIDVLKVPFVNHGELGWKATVRAGGRVGTPAFLMESFDGGETWRSRDMGAHTACIYDVKFLDEKTGFIAGASSGKTDESNARILKTSDGGKTWRTVYQSARPWEITWKIAFPSKKVGYVTVQSYNPDKAVVQRYVAKTTDGGETWAELPVVDDHAWRAFGVGFVDDKRGWIGGTTAGMQTEDGGLSWKPVEMGKAVNKIRVVRQEGATSVFAIGTELHRLDL
ncbi:MAG TPA: hypothetical protein VD929_05135 [Caulobacteraceae bacterium]|nr:hypothetical protein [Caulobacteraceae bacterium]